LAGLLLLAQGSALLVGGRWFGANYWGGQIFWLFSVLIGAVLLGLATIFWRPLRRNLEKPREKARRNGARSKVMRDFRF